LIVLDASAVVELVLGTMQGKAVARRIGDPRIGLHAPHLVDVEVTQVLRRYAREGELDGSGAALALADLRALDLRRHAHEPLLDRVWELRQNVSAYDAVYVALAEVLDAVLLTCDARLARVPGILCRVDVIAERN
jgi:predicted nucleic acid-binding protein